MVLEAFGNKARSIKKLKEGFSDATDVGDVCCGAANALQRSKCTWRCDWGSVQLWPKGQRSSSWQSMAWKFRQKGCSGARFERKLRMQPKAAKQFFPPLPIVSMLDLSLAVKNNEQCKEKVYDIFLCGGNQSD